MRFSGAQAESLGEERAAMAQAFLVDAVTDALRQMPLDRHLEGGKRLRALEQRLRRDEVVLGTVNQQDRWQNHRVMISADPT